MSAERNDIRLPDLWTAEEPDERHILHLARLRADHTASVVGHAEPDVATALSEVTGTASWTLRQRVVLDPSGTARAWVSVRDRAAGRTLVSVTVDPELAVDDSTPLAGELFSWGERAAADVMCLRGVHGTQLDSGAYGSDERQRGWLLGAGYKRARTWLQMSRPITANEREPGKLPTARPGVRIRRVRQHANGLPHGSDVQLIHRVLEESFTDHFNSYRESFPEFVNRMQEDPGHSWDHWWLAFVDVGEKTLPAGALVSTVLPPDRTGEQGSYVEYIGVHARARGRGVAKSLLYTVIADAAARGRNRVGLEVDDDSPTQADGLYASLGWVTSYATESWHLTIGSAETSA